MQANTNLMHRVGTHMPCPEGVSGPHGKIEKGAEIVVLRADPETAAYDIMDCITGTVVRGLLFAAAATA